MKMRTLTVKPAYGRKYRDREEIQRDLLSDKDFRICDAVGPYAFWCESYCSLLGFHAVSENAPAPPTHLNVRFGDHLENIEVFVVDELLGKYAREG